MRSRSKIDSQLTDSSRQLVYKLYVSSRPDSLFISAIEKLVARAIHTPVRFIQVENPVSAQITATRERTREIAHVRATVRPLGSRWTSVQHMEVSSMVQQLQFPSHPADISSSMYTSIRPYEISSIARSATATGRFSKQMCC